MNTNEITAKAVKAIEVAPQYQAIQAIAAWAAGQFFCGGASISVNRWEAITDGEHYRMAARAARKVVEKNDAGRNVAAFAGMGEIYEAAAARLDALYAEWMLAGGPEADEARRQSAMERLAKLMADSASAA